MHTVSFYKYIQKGIEESLTIRSFLGVYFASIALNTKCQKDKNFNQYINATICFLNLRRKRAFAIKFDVCIGS